MKVFIMGVGERDPYWKQEDDRMTKFLDLVRQYGEDFDPTTIGAVEGPILSFFRTLRQQQGDPSPCCIYLLPTADRPDVQGTEKCGNKTKVLLENEVLKGCREVKVFVRAISVTNPTDHRELYPEMRKQIEKIREEVKDKSPEFFVNLQPGIPQMRDVFISLSMIGVINPKFVEVTRAKAVQETDLSFMFEGEILKRATNLLKEGYFTTAALAFVELETVAVSAESQRKAWVFSRLAELYAHWDHLHYEQANAAISAVLSAPDMSYSFYQPLRAILEAQRDTLRRLQGRNSTEYVVDLYHNAKRRIAQENFPDTLWRFVAIYEIILKQEAVRKIKERFKIDADPEDFAHSIAPHRNALKELLREVFDIRDPNDTREFYKKVHQSLGREEAKGILSFLGDPLVMIIQSLPLKDLIDRRNELLHRMAFPKEVDVRKDLDTIRQFIKKVLDRDPEEDYSFSTENLESVAQIIRNIYR